MFPSVERLLPQRGPAVLLDSVLEHTLEATRCSAMLTPEHPYLLDGRIPALLALELLAQTCAVRAALEAATGELPRKGYVVAVPRLELWGGDFAPGDRLEVRVAPLHASSALMKYEGEVSLAGRSRARGELSVVLAEAA